MLNSSGLRYFYQTASLGSMRLASERLGIAISSISRQITQLEQQIGAQLFERGLRVMRLTEAGRLIFDHQRQQRADEETVLAKIADLKRMTTGAISLITGDGFRGRHFNDMLIGFSQTSPGISVSVQVSTTNAVERAILDDEAHIGLILNAPTDPKIRVRQLWDQPLMVVCAPHHPAASQSSFTIADLRQYDLCLPPAHFRFRNMLAEVESRSQTWLSPRFTLSSIDQLSGMVRGGSMLTVLPPLAVFDEVKAGEVVVRPLNEPDVRQSAVSLIYRQGRVLDGAPLRMLSVLEHYVSQWATYHDNRQADGR